jgi:hypothetical protein
MTCLLESKNQAYSTIITYLNPKLLSWDTVNTC